MQVGRLTVKKHHLGLILVDRNNDFGWFTNPDIARALIKFNENAYQLKKYASR